MSLLHTQLTCCLGNRVTTAKKKKLKKRIEPSHVVFFFWLITLLKFFGDMYVSKLKEQTCGKRNRQSCRRSRLEVCSRCFCSSRRNFLYIDPNLKTISCRLKEMNTNLISQVTVQCFRTPRHCGHFVVAVVSVRRFWKRSGIFHVHIDVFHVAME